MCPQITHFDWCGGIVEADTVGAMLSAPLILRGDLGELTNEELAVVSNTEVISR